MNPRKHIIVTATPLRVSFAGGGTDIENYYKHHTGCVLSTTINKYIYVTVKEHGELFEEPVRLNYSETEIVNSIDEVKNNIARECIKLLDVKPPIYISTIADLPAKSGLGSSSSFAVGLLNALHAFKGETITCGQLAEEAAYIEINVLGEPIGKQDQYAAAFGGFNFYSFHKDGEVSIEAKNIGINTLLENTMFFWTGISRKAGVVLAEQKAKSLDNIKRLDAIKSHAENLSDLLKRDFALTDIGKVLDATWRQKRELANSISSDQLDEYYQIAMDAGALGGKISGAGGGGFFMFIVPKERQKEVRKALHKMEQLSVGYEPYGSRILFPSV
jgi:D-glycero-alpha-D-manno-heptose-7-phosphate kinase